MSHQLFSNAKFGTAEAESGKQPPAGPEKKADDIAESSLNLLRQLEASLQASQRALLSGDLEALQEKTCEQLRLQGALQACWSQNGAGARESNPMLAEFAIASDLRAAQMRVLDLGRVQAAILSRANRWLTTVSNLLAGAAAGYSSPVKRWTPCSPRRSVGGSKGVA